jgi:hypothetical protein
VRVVAIGAAAGVAAVVAFASFNYVQNVVRTGELSGGQNAEVARDFVRAGIRRDLARVSWTVLDAPGLPGASRLGHLLAPVSARVVGPVHGSFFDTPPALHHTVSDDESGYGLLGLLVLVPVVSVALVRGPAPARLLALGAGAYLVLLAARLGYSPEAPRLLLPAAVLVSPLLAGVDAHPGRRRALVAAALAGVVPVLTLNPNKPLLLGGVGRVLRDDRIEVQLIDEDARQYLPGVVALDRLIPAEGKLAVVGQAAMPVYALEDPGLHREVIAIAPGEFDPDELRRRGFTAAFAWPPPPDDCPPADCPRLPRIPAAIRLPGDAALLLPSGPTTENRRRRGPGTTVPRLDEVMLNQRAGAP